MGLTTTRQIWLALGSAYSHISIERIQKLRDQLRLTTKGSSSVSDFGRKFMGICDQLSAIGHPVDEADKLHWFLCGLRPAFETFSTSIRTSKPQPPYRDLLVQAKNHELFLRSLHGNTTPLVAFNSQQFRGGGSGNRGSGGRFHHSSSIDGRGRGRRSPQCQLCRKHGNFADSCPNIASFVPQRNSTDVELANAFLAHCNVSTNSPWIPDIGATDHMAKAPIMSLMLPFIPVMPK
ncbi:hypothetical protein HanRHA438_Chr16g0777101 [Helianthus annuus]|nr:hypothetical protein HanRHA438_Chr16g0777101 [Helianthus annuus]